MPLDAQQVEILGRNRLIDELVRAGLETARPTRDRGIDLIAYSESDVPHHFVSRPLQMKAASSRSFGLDRKYRNVPNVLMVYVWGLGGEVPTDSFAMTYGEAESILSECGYVDSPTWQNKGKYAVNGKIPKELLALLNPHRMTIERWRERILGQN